MTTASTPTPIMMRGLGLGGGGAGFASAGAVCASPSADGVCFGGASVVIGRHRSERSESVVCPARTATRNSPLRALDRLPKPDQNSLVKSGLSGATQKLMLANPRRPRARPEHPSPAVHPAVTRQSFPRSDLPAGGKELVCCSADRAA